MRRRAFLGAAAAGGLLLPLGNRAWALSGDGKNRFVFVFLTGGWDHLIALAPATNSDVVERDGIELETSFAQAGDIPFCDHPDRPAIASFMNAYHDRIALVHGIEARSVAHDVCLRLMLTGSSRDGDPDWGTLLASKADVPIPMVVISGPSYSGDLSWAALRIGQNQQLNTLVDGSALSDLTPSTSATADAIEQLEDAYVVGRNQHLTAAAATPSETAFSSASLSAVSGLTNEGGGLSLLEGALSGGIQASCSAAFDLFQDGQAVCATMEFLGSSGLGADTHADNDIQQSVLQHELFTALYDIVQDLDERVDSDGEPLADSTTIVVLSEMGRHPRYNSRKGREHWTFTSVMLIGAGTLRGGQSIGDYDDGFRGERVDLATGLLDPEGSPLLPVHLGSTLMAIAGHDGEAALGVPPIGALLP